MASTISKILDFVLRTLPIKNSFEKIFNSRKFGKGDIKEPPKFLYTTLDIKKIETKLGNNFILKTKAILNSNGEVKNNSTTVTCENIDAAINKNIDTEINENIAAEKNGIIDAEKNEKYVFYLHGGGYIHGFNSIHWLFLKTLAQELDCTIIAPDYPVAPEFTYHESFAMVIPLYKDLITKVGKDNVILMGDSSGGGFALALAQKMHEANIEIASQIILISPWLDITLKNKDIKAIDPQDPILGVKGLRRAGKSYAGKTNPNNYLLSPINGSVEGLGKISILIGTKDILVADTRKFKSIAQAKGVEINYYEYEDMLHVWPLFNLPESKIAIEQIKQIINTQSTKNCQLDFVL